MLMNISSFVGRTKELNTLNEFTRKKTASLVVIKGRRRIGKSRLIEEFGIRNQIKTINFAGLFPEEKVTAQQQRNEFAKQLGFTSLITNDWSDLFRALADRIQKGKVIVLLDEISWMAKGDHTFLPKLKTAWDLWLKKNNQLILIICGSASSWIEKNILRSTGFVGRISFVLTLEELQLDECSKFWGKSAKNITPIEILKVLSVVGGVPKYLEEINPHLNAEDNIKKLCFTNGGILFEEFNNIFRSSFLRNSTVYASIIQALANGPKEATELCCLLNIKPTGRFSEYLYELELAGFVKRDHTWQLGTGLDRKLSKYRLSDNYIRFYIKYISKYKTKIERGSFDIKSLSGLPGWDSIMGLQFENLVLNNRKIIQTMLGVKSDDIISENPYFQRNTSKQKGCQIDYMIQTRDNSLYVCEIKFSKNKVGYQIVNEIQQKINALNGIKRMSYRPVLIHVGGVTKDVETSDYFIKIIDFCDLIKN